MKLWSVILATLVIFGMGVVAGAMLGKKKAEPESLSNSKSRDSNRSRNKHEQARRVEFITKCNRELELSEEQSDQIETIISESQTRTKAIWEEVSPKMRAEMQATQDHIKELLTPDQQAKFEEMMKRSWGPRRNGGGSPGSVRSHDNPDKPSPQPDVPRPDQPPPAVIGDSRPDDQPPPPAE